MKTVVGKKYYIDFHEGPDYTHYHGEAIRVEGGEVIDDEEVFRFEIEENGKKSIVMFGEKDVICERE